MEASGARTCDGCGYVLAGLPPGAACPECGGGSTPPEPAFSVATLRRLLRGATLLQVGAGVCVASVFLLFAGIIVGGVVLRGAEGWGWRVVSWTLIAACIGGLGVLGWATVVVCRAVLTRFTMLSVMCMTMLGIFGTLMAVCFAADQTSVWPQAGKLLWALVRTSGWLWLGLLMFQVNRICAILHMERKSWNYRTAHLVINFAFCCCVVVELARAGEPRAMGTSLLLFVLACALAAPDILGMRGYVKGWLERGMQVGDEMERHATP